jgi:hypothetical protein
MRPGRMSVGSLRLLGYAASVTTIATLIARAQEGLEALALLGEDVEDEWTYVTDLVSAQTLRFTEIAERRADEPAGERTERAVDELLTEIGLIEDPHRAIDWLSTYPDLVALALEEPIGRRSA